MFPERTRMSTTLFDVDKFFDIANSTSADMMTRLHQHHHQQHQRPASLVSPGVTITPHHPTEWHTGLSNPRWTSIPRYNTMSPGPNSIPHDRYKITLNLPAFQQEDIQTHFENGQLVVFARHVNWISGDDYQAFEVKKHFYVPDNCDMQAMTTHFSDNHVLTINIPLKVRPRTNSTTSTSSSQRYPLVSNTGNYYQSTQDLSRSTSSGQLQSEASHHYYQQPRKPHQVVVVPNPSENEHERFNFDEFFSSPFNPSIIDVANGQKKLDMKIEMKDCRPEQISLALRDNELSLKVKSNDDKQNDPDTSDQIVRKVKLPPKVDLDGLKSRLENGWLYIEAPYRSSASS